MANQNDMAAKAAVTHCLFVNLGHQRACRIEVKQIARLGIGGNRFRYTVGRKDHRAFAVFSRDLAKFFDENSAAFLQTLYNIAIVNDFVPDVDGSPVFLQGKYDDLYRPVNTRTKTARVAQADGQR